MTPPNPSFFDQPSAGATFSESLVSEREVTFRRTTSGQPRSERISDEMTFSELEPVLISDQLVIDRHSISSPLAVVPGWLTIRTLPSQTDAYRLGKRIFDVAVGALIFPIAAVLLLVIAVMIAITSSGPVFYRQIRIGQYGRKFKILKFRTMHSRSDRVLHEYLEGNPEAQEEWSQTHKLREDPRITRLGRFLRKTSLDELPQIFNVFRGEMSLVGPRPIVHAEREKYGDRFVYYTAVLPGITGLWQVSGRCDVTYDDRVSLDERYARQWSLMLDLLILGKTPRAVCRGRGAY